ncbi:MAG: glycoside hydrolase family 95 protein [Acidobacteria bacterium]|nr:glycoside hydrolase family 95 protein [Acidobacteriota bacterium]
MKRLTCALFCVLCTATLHPAPALQPAPPPGALTLWYRQPATAWVEALPIGNGRLAAMVFGGIVDERLQINEDTLCAGGPYDPANPEALAALPVARRMIAEGRYGDAHALIAAKMMATPLRQMPFQPLGDLRITFADDGPVERYRRELDLDTAIARVSYVSGGVTYTREVFSSPVDQVIVMRVTADRPRRVSMTVGLSTPQQAAIAADGSDTLVMRGVNAGAQGIKGALTFAARVRVLAGGGQARADGQTVRIRDADAVTVLLAAATSYRSYHDVSGDPGRITRRQLDAAGALAYDRLRSAHVREHQRLFRRVSLDLGPSTVDAPTDERITSFKTTNDPALAALYFQFGRYLLISSSRPGSQPATLQGDWNDQMKPPWESKYTININTEMNYWPAESTNLSELVEPLTALVLDLTHTGARTAKVHYGARGWVAHHNTDLWRASAPVDGPASGMWPTGGAWLCQALWDHYEFTQDRAYLARIYPALTGAAEFFLDTLVEEPSHQWLVTSPSLSPENRHPFGNTSIVAGPAMDSQILRDLFARTVRASEILDRDPELRDRLTKARARLPPDRIGKAGQLQEWLEDWDLQAPDPHHRHVSHLYALYPSEQITVRGTPALAAAARTSLELRGDEATGWGLGWRLNLWARLLDGEHAYRILARLLNPDRTYPNMFDAHPPFQIDGNFGGTAGIAEMLLQSHGGEIARLPALPRAWPAGEVKGLRARGGYEVDLAWREDRLTSATIRVAGGTGRTRVRYGDVVRDATIPRAGSWQW